MSLQMNNNDRIAAPGYRSGTNCLSHPRTPPLLPPLPSMAAAAAAAAGPPCSSAWRGATDIELRFGASTPGCGLHSSPHSTRESLPTDQPRSTHTTREYTNHANADSLRGKCEAKGSWSLTFASRGSRSVGPSQQAGRLWSGVQERSVSLPRTVRRRMPTRSARN
jgi:hypothetical protein